MRLATVKSQNSVTKLKQGQAVASPTRPPAAVLGGVSLTKPRASFSGYPFFSDSQAVMGFSSVAMTESVVHRENLHAELTGRE